MESGRWKAGDGEREMERVLPCDRPCDAPGSKWGSDVTRGSRTFDPCGAHRKADSARFYQSSTGVKHVAAADSA